MRGESTIVLLRWREILEAVIAFRRDARDTEAAFGKVDWLTKRWMLDQLDDDAEWSQRKKIDLRYHELSPDGYYFQFVATRPELAAGRRRAELLVDVARRPPVRRQLAEAG